MLCRFNYTFEDHQIAQQWNPVVLRFLTTQEGEKVGTENTSLIDKNNPGHFFAEFNVNIMPEFPLDWLGKYGEQPISILLVHYNPLIYIKENSVSNSQIEQFRDDSSVLSQKYKKQIVTFQSAMEQLGNHFNQDVLSKANSADVIVCCYGEFMESPYREKHIFQGKSRGPVFIRTPLDYFQCQAFSTY